MRDMKIAPPDIFFAPTSYIIASFAPKNLKTIITVHDLIAWFSPDRHNKKATFIEHRTLPTALKKAHHVMTVSHNTKNDLQKLFHIPDEKISVIPCAASSIFRKIETTEKAHSNKTNPQMPQKFLLSVGTLEPRKNYGALLKSFSKVHKKFPDLSLVIIGSKGWQYKEIFKAVETLKLQNAVHFPDYIGEEELVQYYNAAQAFVYPSLYEGFGIPLLEAMQSGCPVITSNTASLPEVAGDAALLVDPKNGDELTQTIEKILTDRDLREKLIERGFTQAKKFSWKTSAAETIRLFERL